MIHCSKEEAELIREAARRERRTLSGFMLNSVLGRIANQKTMEQKWRDRNTEPSRPRRR